MGTIIVGAGGHGKVVLDILRAQGKCAAGFIDADPSLNGTEVGGIRVLGAINMLPKLRQQKIKYAIVAIGNGKTRMTYAKALRENGFELITAIHPSSVISPTVRIGANCVIAAGAVISTDAAINDSAIINTGAIVDHECTIGEAAHICPGSMLAGRVNVEEGAFVGLGSKVIPCLTIGKWATVGAGTVVIRDVAAYSTVVGTPARVIRIAQQNAA